MTLGTEAGDAHILCQKELGFTLLPAGAAVLTLSFPGGLLPLAKGATTS